MRFHKSRRGQPRRGFHDCATSFGKLLDDTRLGDAIAGNARDQALHLLRAQDAVAISLERIPNAEKQVGRKFSESHVGLVKEAGHGLPGEFVPGAFPVGDAKDFAD